MREAVIVSTARTPIGKAYRGAFNDTESPSMVAPVVQEAIKRAGVEPAEIDDLIMGAALQQGTQGFNVGRQCVVAAGLPVSVAGQSVDRQCSSGLMSISMGAKQIIADGMQTVVAGGVESISLVQNEHMNAFRQADPIVLKHAPAIYMAMIDTAEVVSKRYKISREAQDEYSLKSQRRTFAAQEAGRFNDEIIATTVTKRFDDKKTGETTKQQVILERDECNRPETTLAGLAALPPVKGPGGFITAGNASQLSDGASACVLMERKQASSADCIRWEFIAGWRSPESSPTRWESDPYSRFQSFWNATGSKSTTSVCGNSMKPSPARSSTAATSSAFPMSFSTSTAARFRLDILMG